jgi:2-methylcitrate dehydratase PrpD
MTRKESDQTVRALMSRVEVVHDPAQEREPRVESARVTATLRNGDRQEVFVDGVSGFPTHPMTHQEVEAKALELMGPGLGDTVARRVVQQVWALEQMADVTELVTTMSAV